MSWVFVTKHTVVLHLVTRHPGITALEVGKAMVMTERGVRKIIADLYAGGYIKKERVGKGVRYQVNADQPLRPSIFRASIGDLLKLLVKTRDT